MFWSIITATDVR